MLHSSLLLSFSLFFALSRVYAIDMKMTEAMAAAERTKFTHCNVNQRPSYVVKRMTFAGAKMMNAPQSVRFLAQSLATSPASALSS